MGGWIDGWMDGLTRGHCMYHSEYCSHEAVGIQPTLQQLVGEMQNIKCSTGGSQSLFARHGEEVVRYKFLILCMKIQHNMKIC